MKCIINYETVLNYENGTEAIAQFNKEVEAFKRSPVDGWKYQFTDNSYTIRTNNPEATYKVTLLK